MADNYQVKNAAGSNITISAKEVATGIFSNRTTPQVGGSDVASGNPMPVVNSITAPFFGQGKIAVGGTAQALPAATLARGILITAKSSNVSNLFGGLSGVTVADDGTGSGYRLEPAQSVSIAVASRASIFIIGATTNDIFYYTGN